MKQGLSQNKPVAKVEKIYIEYKGDSVEARRLTVSSMIPIEIARAWTNVQTPELLQFVAKGMIKFKSVDGEGFPKKWQEGQTYGAKMRVFGFIPFGGIHYLNIVKIDSANYQISTKEWDKSAKVWNHDVRMEAIGTDSIYYADSIEIYGGFMTGFITAFAKLFYKHRQKRWQIVARENLEFGK
ncbi:hypothetical protein [Fulvivirga lutea]|nr:hypothetical protein [Fulvivirga lutea]